MSPSSHSETHGPYRVVRVKDGVKSYFAGHHENGQVKWVDSANHPEAVRYPDTGLAATVQRNLTTDVGESLNVVRIT